MPRLWTELIDETLRRTLPGGGRGSLPAVVFDPTHYVQTHSGRPVYTPEPDSRLLHLGHELYHRVMSTFARYRFPGGPDSATRWTTRLGGVPAGLDALVLLTVEELAVNTLREPCHHWVHTLRLPVVNGALGAALDKLPASELPAGVATDREDARELWDDIEDDAREVVRQLQRALTGRLQARITSASAEVIRIEERRFSQRIKEIQSEREKVAAQVKRDAEKLISELRQGFMFPGMRSEREAELARLQTEVDRRRAHYNTWLDTLRSERDRVLNKVLPQRYTLRGEARVYPIAVEIRLPGGEQ